MIKLHQYTFTFLKFAIAHEYFSRNTTLYWAHANWKQNVVFHFRFVQDHYFRKVSYNVEYIKFHKEPYVHFIVWFYIQFLALKAQFHPCIIFSEDIKPVCFIYNETFIIFEIRSSWQQHLNKSRKSKFLFCICQSYQWKVW